MYVFSMLTAAIGGRWYCASPAERSITSGVSTPSASSSGRSWMPEFAGAPPDSYRYTCARVAHSTSVPCGAWSPSASWLAIVPDGTNSAASIPKSAAASDCSRLTVGSSPYASSPTSASAIARRISGVGVVTVSDRRSTTSVMRGLRDRPDETLLDDRDGERAVTPEHVALREPAGAGRGRALLVVEQPFVGAERTVEPHRVVEARGHHTTVVPQRVRQGRGVDERHVARVRDDTRVQQRVVGHRRRGPEPLVLRGLALLASEPLRILHVAHLDRCRALQPLERTGREAVALRVDSLAHRRQVVGIGHIGHRHLVIGARLVDLERRCEIEDRGAVLDGDHAPRREAASVADAVHLVHDRDRRIAGTQEVRVQRVHAPVVGDRAARGDECLRSDLPAEDALVRRLGAQPPEEVHLERLEV